jgi:predicted negative regulator of RcsB-dependent stress response
MYDLEEQEKIDALKYWWKRNGKAVMVGAVAFVLVLFGVQGWRSWQRSQTEAAATLFDAVVTAAGAKDKDVKKIVAAAKAVEDGYPNSGYAPRAAFVAAKAAADANDRATSKEQLEWAANHASEPQLKEMARLRLAGVLADDKHYDDALAQLAQVSDAKFAALAAALKGDILVAQGKLADARKAYKAVLDAPGGGQIHQITQTKLDALGEGS